MIALLVALIAVSNVSVARNESDSRPTARTIVTSATALPSTLSTDLRCIQRWTLTGAARRIDPEPHGTSGAGRWFRSRY